MPKGNSGEVKSGAAIVAEVTAWSYEGGVGIVEKPPAMNDTAADYSSDGRKTGTGSVTFNFDSTDVPQGTFVEGATIALILTETTPGSGAVTHTGSVVIGSVSKAGGPPEWLQRTCAFSGVLTEAVTV